MNAVSVRSLFPCQPGKGIGPLVVILQVAVFLPVDLPAGEGVQRHGVDAVEDALFDIRFVFFEPAEQLFDFRPLGIAAAVATLPVPGQRTRTMDKRQPVRIRPGKNIFLMHAVQRPYEFHAFKVLTAELWHHRLQLGTVEHPHERRFDNVVEMMSQRDLVAAQFLRLFIKRTAPHAGAQVTRGSLPALLLDYLENLLFKKLNIKYD